jgi:membrane protein DedA with SNARE-associated domain
MSFVTHLMNSLRGWPLLALVFLVPALEASVFLGFVFPGETAVVFGGAVAGQHHANLVAVAVAAVLGAVIGDTVGFLVGRRWGEWLVAHTAGRFVREENIAKARAYVARRGGRAVFLGRWTAVLRALVPGAAGMAGMRYGLFLPWNMAGGTVWAVACAVAGWAAGASWNNVVKIINRAGLVGIGAIVVIVVAVVLVRRRRERRLPTT